MTPPKWEPRQRRARVRPEPAVSIRSKPGERLFRIILKPGFTAFGVTFLPVYSGWTVKVLRIRAPGDTEYRQYYQLRNGPFLHLQTQDPFYIRREMGDELYSRLPVPLLNPGFTAFGAQLPETTMPDEEEVPQ